MDIQIVEWTRTPYYPGVGFLSTSSPQRRFYSLQGNVVLDRNLFPVPGGDWDTLYFLGVPGDRWWPRYTDQTCPPLGMIEIQDTGHVIIDGINLRTWDLAYLNEAGQPIPEGNPSWGDTLGIIEHIGSMPGGPPMPCTTQNWDICGAYRLHYSDDLISFPDETFCDITTYISTTGSSSAIVGSYPNPGTDQLTLTGLSSTSHTIEVRDPLGRLIHTQNMAAGNAIIETSVWPSGTYFVSIVGSELQFIKWMKE